MTTGGGGHLGSGAGGGRGVEAGLEAGGGLGDDRTRRLLGLALSKDAAPIERVVARLSAEGGDAWCDRAMGRLVEQAGPEGAGAFVEGDPSLQVLVRAKDAMKRWTLDASGEDADIAVFGYFLVLARAKHQNVAGVSGRSNAEVDGALSRLRPVVSGWVSERFGL